MRVLFSILLLYVCTKGLGQTKKFVLEIVYSPQYSNVIGGAFNDDFSVSHLVGGRYVHYLGRYKKACFSVGLSFFNTAKTSKNRQPYAVEYDEVIRRTNRNFICIPIGYKILFGRFFLHPELAFGYNTSNKIKAVDKFLDGRRQVHRYEAFARNGSFHRFELFSIAACGYQWELEDCFLRFGITGHFGLLKAVRGTYGSFHRFGGGIFIGVGF